MKYIDKDRVVSEIENLRRTTFTNFDEGVNATVQVLLEVLDTLEVKEVNIWKEAEMIANSIMIAVQTNRYNTVVYNTKRNDFNHSHLYEAAKKGIELGLKAQKGE